MAIVDEAGQHETLTTGERALDLFTDRVSLIRHFAKLLNEDPASNKILFFHGDGGNGKSLLLRYLARYYCKWLEPDNWNWVASKSDAEFVEELKLAEGETSVPVGFLDFSFPGRTDSLNALRKLRRDLGEHGIHFPLFDFACFWHLKKTGQLTDDQIKNLFADEELDLIAAIVDEFSQIPGIAVVKAALAVIHKRFTGRRVDERFTHWLRSRKLDQNDLRAITTMDPERELIDKLSVLFAKDLNAAIALQDWPKRVVLLFDGHEAFWGTERNRRSATYFQRDTWLRCLLSHLELGYGIVAVVAGREFPSWPEPEADPYQIEEQSIDHRPVGDLSNADAQSYLERALAGINVSDDLYPFLCDYARVARDRVHPLYLAMCAEIVVAAAKKKQSRISQDDVRLDPKAPNKARALINRFLSYADAGVVYAVPILSACRSFDRDLYMTVGEALKIQPSQAVFDNLIEFSFVRKEVGTKPSNEPRSDGAADSSTVSEKESSKAPKFRIHDLLRRVYFEQADDLVREANVALERYFREHVAAGDRTAIAEAIYHANRLDWERGASEWIDVFEEALSRSNYELCQALLDVKTELFLDTDFSRALVSQTEGEYLAVLARYDAAKQAFSDAIAAYDQYLQHTPVHVDVLNNKGNALQRLGDLHTILAEYSAAKLSYTNAIEVYGQALDLEPGHVYPLNNKGNALAKLGGLQATLSQHAAAKQSYTEAIAAYEQVLRYAPEHLNALNNKGNVLTKLADLQGTLSEFAEAAHSYTAAIAAFSQVLRHASDFIIALSSKGNALAKLGDLQDQLDQHALAQQNYTEAIAYYDQGLQHAPDDIEILNNKGNALAKLGHLQAALSEPTAAKQSYAEAIAALDQALSHAPDHLYALNNKGNVLMNLGDVQVQLQEYMLARQSYIAAITSFDQSFRQALDHPYAHNNKGIALWKLGALQLAAFSDCDGAKKYFQRSIAAFSRSLEITPGDGRIRTLLETVKTALRSLDC